MTELACVAGVEKGRGYGKMEKGKGDRGELVRGSLPFSPLLRFSSSPSPFWACHSGETEQIQILQRRLECISKDLKVLWIA